ncbi:sumo deconjugating cysteine peptidase ulp2 [Lentinula edodes]|uniref:Sumo deconjugating cysteine peptidase ulp2 n=1 Tax=Lentinula edodes TaxID=5353 RepID=A0A1Q3EGZ7_LENED|nr:sumo deconjugating cysteine peptidase ulp2 [Lentinula edodes]
MLVLTALLIFERVKVDIVVMEVGMGGRLDATNVIPDEVVMISALTAVDLDHQAFLGDTVAAITKEKASIARRARMVVQEAGGDFFSAPSALQMPSEDQRRPESYSQFQPPSPCPIELNMPCFRDPFNALLPLHGSHQLENVGAVMAAKGVSASDRQTISSLSHLPASGTSLVLKKPPRTLRDASISSNTRTKWDKPPTLIPVPSNSMQNPYNSARFHTNLDSSRSQSYGSRQKQQTLTGRSLKRRKTAHAPLVAKDPQQDITLIPNEDDAHEAESFFNPAPLKPKNLRNTPKETPVTLISSEEEDEGPSAHLNGSVSGPPDGHSTRSSEVEDISEFSDSEVKPGQPGKIGYVKEQARKLDRNEQANLNRKMAVARVATVPHLDLKQLPNVKNGMKPRTTVKSVKSMQFGDPKCPEPCIKFTSRLLHPLQRHTGIGQRWGGDFKPGERGNGEVSLKIDIEDPIWSPQIFDAFRTFCKRVVPYECTDVVGLGANRALWSFAQQAAGSCENDTSMEYAEVESDPLNNNIREEEIPEYDHLPMSNERNGIVDKPTPREPRKSYTTRQSSNTSETRNTTVVVRRSTRQQQNQGKQGKKQPSEDPDEIILSYPPGVTTGAVKITNGDYNRLLPDEYLNDTLIEFGLKLWHHELATEDPQLANQIHVFNSFFYKKLNKKSIEEGYQSVRRWTSRFDIFSKKFVIVPINENMHWYLAIIHLPELVLLPPPERELPNTRHHTRSSNVYEDLISSVDAPDNALSPAAAAASSNEAEFGSTLSGRRSLISTTPSGSASRAASPSEASAMLEETKPSSEADAEETFRGLTTMDISVDIQIPSTHEKSPSPCTPLVDEPMDVDGSADERTVISPSFTSLVTSSRDPRDRSLSMGVEQDQHHGNQGKHISPSRSKTSTVTPASFYAVPARSNKGKEKAINLSDEVSNGDVNPVHSSSRETSGQPITMIFTLDSLGNKHPKVINTLSKYLQLEAIDKKHLHNTSKALGRNLPVPTQPNFCDCGVYLIHFAQVFVKKADYLSRISKKGTRSQVDRQVDWEGHRLDDFRDELRMKVEENAPNDEARRTEPVVHGLSDSDSDIDIVETSTLTIPHDRKAKTRIKSDRMRAG